jgi:hypothetical protein
MEFNVWVKEVEGVYVVRSCKSKERQHNGQKKKNKVQTMVDRSHNTPNN